MSRSTPDLQTFLPLSEAVLHILLTLIDRERHGYAIMQDVAACTEDRLKLSASTLYGCVKRMLDSGLIAEADQRPDPESDDERRRYYSVTTLGKRVALAEVERLTQLVAQARALGLRPVSK
jgi:DNA-binding PadR family transcriptional regulator